MSLQEGKYKPSSPERDIAISHNVHFPPTESLENVITNSYSDLRKRSKENQERTITKEGSTNFIRANISHQKKQFFSDIFTTIVDMKWRWTLLTFCSLYFGSWLIFATLWYLILYIHGDTINNVPGELMTNGTGEENGHKACMTGIHTFTAAFLFSIETQHTTGYGHYQITEECTPGIILFCLQSMFGCTLEGTMVGLVFVKLSRAKKRRETLIFSRNAVITLRDGVLCFMFRVGDMRKSHIIEAHVRAQLIKKRNTEEGEVISYHQQELEVGADGEKFDNILLFWPTIVVHRITESSPLFNITERDLSDGNTSFEIIVVLEGVVESTGLNTQARSSYTPSEILWDHRFENLTSSKTANGDRIIDYSLFHKTLKVDKM